MAMANTCNDATSMDAACIFYHPFHSFVHDLLEAAKEIIHVASKWKFILSLKAEAKLSTGKFPLLSPFSFLNSYKTIL